jgi:predicted GNAT superfamily acetyltransferase
MNQIEVLEVSTPQEFQQFFEFPWKVNKHNSNWVPPLKSARLKLLDKKKNPSWEYLDGIYLAAWQGNEVVGTIVVYVNSRHNQEWHESAGWFGMFECIDNQAVANALLGSAEEWVRARGLSEIKGPQTFTTHEETGLLIENFAKPAILMPWNPPYYRRLLETAGYKVHTNLFSFQGTDVAANQIDPVKGTSMLTRLEKLTQRTLRGGKVRIRPFNMKYKQGEFENLRQIYAHAWDKNWGFVSLTDRELDSTVDELGQLVNPKLAFFAEVLNDSGTWELAGMAIAVEDLNRAIHWANPQPHVPEWWTLLKIAWRWKVMGIKQLRLALLGVMPNHRERGIDVALMHAVASSGWENGYTEIDCGWVLETNPLVGITTKLGLKKYKTHAWFSKEL